MEGDLWLLFLRFGILALLYVFLIQLAIVLRRTLSSTTPTTRTGNEAPKLVVVESSAPALIRGQSFALQSVTTIGRAPNNSIAIDDPFVSSEHAVINTRDGEIWLEDIGSTNGTFVNRRQIGKPVLLQTGDVIQIGQVKFKITR